VSGVLKKRCKPSGPTRYAGRFEREIRVLPDQLIVVILAANRELNNFCRY
jgi:hypothetical protein